MKPRVYNNRRGASHCKMRSMKFIQNYHNEYTKFNFGMLIVVILYEFHTSHFAVQLCCPLLLLYTFDETIALSISSYYYYIP